MNQARVRSGFVGAGMLIGLALASAPPARAAVYVGHWDPAFGPDTIFTDLSWSGDATFILPDSCNGLPSGLYSNLSPGCGGGGMEVLNASFQLSSISNPSSHETLFAGNAPVVNGMLIETVGGVTTLVGTNTGYFSPVAGSIPAAMHEGQNYDWSLFFSGEDVRLAYTLPGVSPAACLPFEHTETECGVSQVEAHVTYTPVIPEPETYALFGAGLLAMGAMLRRRSRAPGPR